MNIQYINPEHAKLWQSMQNVEKKIQKKGLTEYKDKYGKWQTENPTLKAIKNDKPLDYYWSKRFKGWHEWEVRIIW